MKLIGFLFFLSSVGAGLWAVNKTVEAMHAAANVVVMASR